MEFLCIALYLSKPGAWSLKWLVMDASTLVSMLLELSDNLKVTKWGFKPNITKNACINTNLSSSEFIQSQILIQEIKYAGVIQFIFHVHQLLPINPHALFLEHLRASSFDSMKQCKYDKRNRCQQK